MEEGLRAVDVDLGAGDVVGLIGATKGNQLSDLIGGAGLVAGERDATIRKNGTRGEFLFRAVIGIVADLGIDGAGADDIDADALVAELDGDILAKAAWAALVVA